MDSADSRRQDGEERFCDLRSGIRLCHRFYGPPTGAPIVLVAGLGLQLTYWPQSLIAGFVERGYRVLVFDNRDVGRSSRVDAASPRLVHMLTRRALAGAYDLSDMAGDVLGLMEHAGLEQVHLVGMSMGGMIAQTMAAHAPARILSLTSIFSTTGAASVGQPSRATFFRLLQAPPRSRTQAVERVVSLTRSIGPTAFAVDDEKVRADAAQAWDRGNGERSHEGVARQIGAIMKSGDRSALLKRIQAPTLVIHGDRDRLVHPSGGIATVEGIANADMVFIRGMGHYLADGVVPYLVDLIDGHARRSAGASPLEQRELKACKRT